MCLSNAWSEQYGLNNSPTWENIAEYVNNKLWGTFGNYVETTYNILPKIEYSKCTMQKG